MPGSNIAVHPPRDLHACPWSSESLTRTMMPHIPGICWPLVACDSILYPYSDFYKLGSRGGFWFGVRVIVNNSQYWPSFSILRKNIDNFFFCLLCVFLVERNNDWQSLLHENQICQIYFLQIQYTELYKIPLFKI